MQSMKVRGFHDAACVATRAQKLRALGRISGKDEEYIVNRAKEIMARIIAMEEVDAKGDPIGEEE
jgi:hypothetical protein